MSGDERRSAEQRQFERLTRLPHGRINPCFMTGKGCVHTETIDKEIEARAQAGDLTGFLIMPFQPNINVFFELCLRRYLSGDYQFGGGVLGLERADQIQRTGYVICEKICRRIQACDFIVADVSVPNPNVFYELGLAYGCRQKLLVVHHMAADPGRADETGTFGKQIVEYLAEGGCRPHAYRDLAPLTVDRFPLSERLWEYADGSPSGGALSPQIVLLAHDEGPPESASTSDIQLAFDTHAMAAIGVSIDSIVGQMGESDERDVLELYKDTIASLKVAKRLKGTERFREVKSEIDRSFCTVIRTGAGCDVMAYFWLGYCHALGRNVVPVTVIEKAGAEIDDLAFDVRALWHMTFAQDSPDVFAQELQGILNQMVVAGFAEWSRRGFWDGLLGRRGMVSIFTGALHNRDIGREMIGDWDLRAASELTSYFARHQYRVTIESPVYEPGLEVAGVAQVTREEYLTGLREMLQDKNCVIIASPDVNPLTELVLGAAYGLTEDWVFTGRSADVSRYPQVVVAVKYRAPAAEELREQGMPRTFYEETTSEQDPASRGFRSKILRGEWLPGEFVSQQDRPKESFRIHAHLLIAPNPFRSQDTQEPRYVIVLNGVSGPATFALTHVLTGGMSEQFVSYDSAAFSKERESERALADILEELEAVKSGQRAGVQAVFEVTAGSSHRAPGDTRAGERIFDWRRIKGWRIVTVQPFERQ